MLMVVLILLAVGTLTSATFFSIVGYHTLSTQREIDRERASALADAGINRAFYEIKQNSSWSGVGEVTLGNGSYEVIVTSAGADRKIDSIGYVPSKSSPKAKRKVRAIITSSPGVGPFSFASQSGTGGVELDSNATIRGNVYSNGNITCASNSRITGDGKAVGTIDPDACVEGVREEGAPFQPLPEFDSDYWKNAANQNPSPGCPSTSSITYSAGTNTLGPCQVNGSLTIDGSAKLIMTGPIYVTGNFTMDSNSELILDDSFGENNTIMLVDGKILVKSNATIKRSQTTAVLRPDGDYTTQWSVTGPATHWEAIDEAVNQPGAGDTTDYISSGDDEQIDELQMSSATDVGAVTEIVVWAYARNTASNKGDKLGVNLVIDGTPQIEQDKALTTSFGWVNATFTVAINQISLDGLRVRLREVRDGSQDSVRVATMYARVRYSFAGRGYIGLVSATSTEWAIDLNSNNSGGLFYALNDGIRLDSNMDVVAIVGQKIHLNSNADINYDQGLPNSSFTSGPSGGWFIKRGSWRVIE